MNSQIVHPELAEIGAQKIAWARAHMPVLGAIAERFREERPFEGKTLCVSVHLEAKTAVLAQVLYEGGAEVIAMGSNPLSTQDDICAGLAASGVTVLSKHGCTNEEYDRYLVDGLSALPHAIIDDGGDLTQILHATHPEFAARLLGGSEETTTGVIRLKARERADELRFPMVLVNDADCKHLFDNRYGTGQSVWDGILRTTNLTVAGSTVVVAGYGWCGRGAAMRAKGLGARVIVTEVDPVKAIEAVMDGFSVMPMAQAAPLGDFFVTLTGCDKVITTEHFPLLKNGAVLSNAGHFDVEVDVAALRAYAVKSFPARPNIEGFVLPNGNTVYLLGEGRLVNLACGDGHPVEIIDMSFALQALCAEYIVKHGAELKNRTYAVPREIDAQVAALKLASLGVKIDALTDEQKKYLSAWA